MGLDFISLADIVGLVILFLIVWVGLTLRDAMRVRVLKLQAQRARARGIMAPAQNENQATLIVQMRDLLRRADMLRPDQMQEANTYLAQAGIRTANGALFLLFARLSCPIAAAVLAVGWLYGLGGMSNYSEGVRVMAFVGIAFLGYKAPDLYLQNMIKKRQEAIMKSMSDILDLLVICTEAGLTLDAALFRVARETHATAPELASELGLAALETAYLPSRQLAYLNLAQRVPLEQIKRLSSTFIQTERYGTPVAEALRGLAAELRQERVIMAEEKAGRLPTLMTLPLVLFLMPALFVVLLGPATCSAVDSFSGAKSLPQPAASP